MKEIAESEVRAQFFADTGEKRSEIFADFRPSMQKKAAKKFTKNPPHFPTRDKTKFFHRENLGVGSPKKKHININFLVRLPLGRPWDLSHGQTGFVPGTSPLCPRDPRFSSYFPQWKPSLSMRQPQGRRAAGEVYALKVKSLCAFFARYDSHTLKSLAMRKKKAFSLAMRKPLRLF